MIILLELLLKMIEINSYYSIGIPIGLAISTLIFILYKTYMLIPWKTILLKEVHKKLEPRKRGLFEEATPKIASQMEEERCEVLEIGVGTGENFKFFPKDSNVTILDNTDRWLSTLKESFKVRPDLQISKLIVESAEHMKSLESNSFDMVVHTLLLCSVENYRLVLDEVYRVLKPGGVCVFIEHSLNVENKLNMLVQKLISPIWCMLQECRFLPMQAIMENETQYAELKLDKCHFLGIISDPVIFGYGKK